MVSFLGVTAGAGVVVLTIKLAVKLTTTRCKCTTRLDGKTVLIVGGNAGIGKVSALELAKRGGRVIIASRNVAKSEEVRTEIIKSTGNTDVEARYLNLASFASVRKFADDFLATESRLDVLINNSACATTPGQKTQDGNDVTTQVNHLGHFLLTNLLLGLLKRSAPSRIIVVSSQAHETVVPTFNPEDLNDVPVRSYSIKNGFQTYCITKLCNMLMVNELASRLHGTGVTVNGLHPGMFYTDLWNGIPKFIEYLVWPFCRSHFEGAQTTIHVALSPNLKETSGKYFVDCEETPASEQARDSKLARVVWDTSAKMVGLGDKNKLYLKMEKKKYKDKNIPLIGCLHFRNCVITAGESSDDLNA